MAFDIDPDIEKVLRRFERSDMPWLGSRIRDFLSDGVENDETEHDLEDEVPKRPFSREEQVEETIRLVEIFTVMPLKMAYEAKLILGRLSSPENVRSLETDGSLYLLDEDRELRIPVTDGEQGPFAVERMNDVVQRLRGILDAPNQ